MTDILPASDIWWRYFIYGALLHLAAATPLAKNDRQAEIIRFAGYALGVIPILFREGFIAGVWMVAFLYGWSLSIKYIKGMFS